MLSEVAEAATVALPSSGARGANEACLQANNAYLSKVKSVLRQAAAVGVETNGGLPYGFTLSASRFRDLELPAPVLAFMFGLNAQDMAFLPPPEAADYLQQIVLCLHRPAAAMPARLRSTRARYGGLSVFVLRQALDSVEWRLEPKYHLIPYAGCNGLAVSLAPQVIPFHCGDLAPLSGMSVSGESLTTHALGVALNALGKSTDNGASALRATSNRLPA